jgi:hypothetical protein
MQRAICTAHACGMTMNAGSMSWAIVFEAIAGMPLITAVQG